MFNDSRFSKLGKAMEDYQKSLAQVQDGVPAWGLREMLGSLEKVMKDSADQLVESLDRIEDQHEARARQIAEKRAESAKKLEEAKQARAEALARLAARKASRAARVQTQEQANDSHLGVKLRNQLLEEFGTREDRHPPGFSQAQRPLIDYDPWAAV